jgi:hypothetical protein
MFRISLYLHKGKKEVIIRRNVQYILWREPRAVVMQAASNLNISMRVEVTVGQLAVKFN